MEAEAVPSFWRKVWQAFQRLIALAIFALADYGLKWIFARTILRDASKYTLSLIDYAGQVAFIALYVYLLWDMLAVFLPILRKKPSKAPIATT